MRRRHLVTLTAALVLTLAAPAMAVDEGKPDGDRHPNVGALAYDTGEGFSFLCTGFVLSDRAFVTAAHCIDVFPDARWGVSLDPGSAADPVYEPGLFPDDFPFPMLAPVMPATEVVVHPDFDPERRAHDVAVLLFPAGTFAGVKPVKLAPAHLLERRARGGGLRFRLVGYGADPEGESFMLEGYRQTATAPFLALTPDQLLMNGDPAVTGQGGLCLGDSGSPQFLQNTKMVVSLFSTHDEDCRGVLFSQRLDTASERRFLSRYG